MLSGEKVQPEDLEPAPPEPEIEIEEGDEVIEETETLLELSDEDGERLLDWHRDGVAIAVQRWRMHPNLKGLRFAEALVINVRTAEERKRGRTIADEVRRNRRYPARTLRKT